MTDSGSCTRTSVSRVGRDRAAHEREMRRVGQLVAIDDEPERAVLRGERALGDALDQPLGAAAVVDQVGDRADLQAVLGGEDLEIGQPRHRAVVVHDLAQHRRRREAGEPREVAARLGVPGARQHAARLRDQRKHVARLHDVLGPRVRAPRPRGSCARDRRRRCRW